MSSTTTTKNINGLIPALTLIFSSVLWGVSWLPLQLLKGKGIDGIPLILISQCILGLLFTYHGWQFSKQSKHWGPLLGIALCGGGAILCFTYALTYGEVIRVMALFYLLPVWGVLGGKVFLGENVGLIRWLGVAMAIVGAFLILGGSKVFSAPPTWLDAMALASGILFAANNMFFRGVTTLPLPTKLMTMFYGCSALCALAMLLGVQSFPSSLSINTWGWVLVYTIFWLLIANIASQWAVTQMETGRSSIILIVELLAAVASAMWIGGESLSGSEWLGCFLILVAAITESLRFSTSQEGVK